MKTLVAMDMEMRVKNALRQCRELLDAEKSRPSIAAETQHSYEDKYALAEVLTALFTASQKRSLEAMDLKGAGKLTGKLRLSVRESCDFLIQETHEEDSASKVVSTSLMMGKTTHKVVTTVKQWRWRLGCWYELKMVSDDGDVILATRAAAWEILTKSDKAPRPAVQQRPDLDLDLDLAQPSVSIDRSKARTPRRNKEMDDALEAARETQSWAVAAYDRLAQAHASPWNVSNKTMLEESTFVPVLPLLRDEGVLAKSELDSLLQEEARGRESLEKRILLAFPPPAPGVIMSQMEAQLLATLRHLAECCSTFASSIDYLESLLRQQVTAAIGKTVTAADFVQYMRFHQKALYAPQYAPQPFSFAVRADQHHSPEGTLAIEYINEEPVETMRRRFSEPVYPMTFSLDASTRVTFGGERYLHVFMPHAFEKNEQSSNSHLTLLCRARQFSSFMVLVGRIGPNRTFEPKHALVVRNKDEVKIPLMLEQLPSASEFKEAISSLSPEQQRFCRAYRAMQLEGSVFAVLTVQLRPQLEKVLRLPPDSLTKEIALTQKLLELFIEYQIPSDLLSYDGDDGKPVEAVRGHVGAIYQTLDAAKQEEIDAKKQEFKYEHPSSYHQQQQQISEEEDEECCDGDFGAPPPASMRKMKKKQGGFGGSRGGGGLLSSIAASPKMRSSAPMEEGASSPGAMMMCMSAPMEGASPGAIMPPPPPKQVSSTTPQPALQQSNIDEEGFDKFEELEAPSGEPDLTQFPAALEASFERCELGRTLRPTKINIGQVWRRTSRKNLLAKAAAEVSFDAADQKTATQQSFDLLDALSKSGALHIDCCSLHAVVAATHCFDASLMDTLVVKNVNPIEKLERSSLVIAATVHAAPPNLLVKAEHLPRIANMQEAELAVTVDPGNNQTQTPES